ncbi:MAG: hypothetical protein AB3N63_00830 [Puniceicoccaceae bacterium]
MKNRSHLFTSIIIPIILPLAASISSSLQASIIFTESFETDGIDSRYFATGNFSDGYDDYFMRTDGSAGASGIPDYTGITGSWFWAAEDIDASENVEGVALLDFTSISLESVPAIQISIDIGAGTGSAFDSVDDFLLVQYRVDLGDWTTALAFQNNGQVYNGPLLQDSDFDGIGDINQLGLELQSISSAVLPVSGTFMDLRIDTVMTSGSEAIAFDNIQVMSVPEPNETALAFAIASILLLLARRFLPRRED